MKKPKYYYSKWFAKVRDCDFVMITYVVGKRTKILVGQCRGITAQHTQGERYQLVLWTGTTEEILEARHIRDIRFLNADNIESLVKIHVSKMAVAEKLGLLNKLRKSVPLILMPIQYPSAPPFSRRR